MASYSLMFNGHSPKKWNRRNRRLRRSVELEWAEGDYGMVGDTGTVGFEGLGKTTGGYIGQGATGFSLCEHWRSPVRVGDTFIWASGEWQAPISMPGPEPHPTHGMYLDRGWLPTLGGIASASIECPIPAWWPFVILDWSDQGSIDDDWYKGIVEMIVGWLKEDGARVEVGCIGAHGRTGTLIAGVIAMVEDLSAADAIEAVRDRHCKRAIEGYAQECQVYRFRGEPVPEKLEPPPIASVVVTGTASPKLVFKEGRWICEKCDLVTAMCRCFWNKYDYPEKSSGSSFVIEPHDYDHRETDPAHGKGGGFWNRPWL